MSVFKSAIRWTMAAGLVIAWMGCQQPDATDKACCPMAAKCDMAGKPGCCPAACPMAKFSFLDKVNGPKGAGWVPLCNGKDMGGWISMSPKAPMSWKVADGMLVNEKAHGVNIYTEQKWKDFEFYAEYKLPPGGNSGIFLRGLYEIQIKDDFGVPSDKPSDWGNGGLWSMKAPPKNVSKPPGEWQSIYARIVDDRITVILNGETTIDNFKVDRPTVYYDEMKPVVKPGEPGPVLLQGDHKPIEYRHVMVRPIS